MADPVLVDLAREVRALAESPEHRARRALWASLHALQPPRALVSYGMYTHVWERDVAPPGLCAHAAGLERAIEVQLRARLWKAEHVPDDEPVLPTVWLWAPRPAVRGPLWGVDLPVARTEEAGAYKPEPPMREEGDLVLLLPPRYVEDKPAARALIERATELLDGVLPVKLHTDELHYGPFEWAVRMRGMDALLYDVVDRPAFVHRLMAFVTEAMVAYHRERERAGAVDPEASWGFHMVWDEASTGPGGRLADSWAYVHAQSAASLSPAMYSEFVQPYNERIAALFGRIYYHGCEDLSRKARVIGRIPNLRLFHVSPWTPVRPVVEALEGRCAFEVHAHPTRVLMTDTRNEMRAEMKRRHAECGSAPHVLKLCDVERIEDAGRLRAWAEETRSVTG